MKLPTRKTFLAATFAIGFFVVLILLIFHEQPQANRDILNVLLGAFATLMFRIVQNEFPSRSDEPKAPEVKSP